MTIKAIQRAGKVKSLVLGCLSDSPATSEGVLCDIGQKAGVLVVRVTLCYLRRRGLVEVVGGFGRRRWLYRLTDSGAGYLERERRRAAARTKIVGKGY